MKTNSLMGLLALAPLIAGCEGISGLTERSSNEGTALEIGSLSGDPTFRPTATQLAISADSKTLYFAGRSEGGADSSIYAFDIGSHALKTIVPTVAGLGRIVALPGDDILYSLATGEIRRAGRNRLGSDTTSAIAKAGGEKAFVVSANGRFVFRRVDHHGEITDLTTGATRTIAADPILAMAVRDDGDEVVYRDDGLRTNRVTILRVSTNATRSFELPSPQLSYVAVSAARWVGDTLLALTYERYRLEPELTRDGVPKISEIDIDRGTKRILGEEGVSPVSPLGWAAGAHRAAVVKWNSCRSTAAGDCIVHNQDLIDLHSTARKVGTVYSDKEIVAATLSPDGRILIYMADRLMMKTL